MSETRLARMSFYLLRLLLWTMLLSRASSRPTGTEQQQQQQQTAVQVERRQTSNAAQHPLCLRSAGTCDYYRNCIDQKFPCGSSGFVLQYAMKRCKANQKLEPPTTLCYGPSCINLENEALVSWSHKVEECIQANLSTLVDGEFSKIKADPSTCQVFERRALEIMNACYRVKSDQSDKPELCHQIGDEIDEEEEKDLESLVSAFHLGGDYHNATVNSGIPELVRECGHSDIADSLYVGRPTYRLIFCTWARKYKDIPISTPISELIINYLSSSLGDDSSNFVYSGFDASYTCRDNVAPNAQTQDIDYHIITWFASAANMVARNFSETEAFIHSGKKALTGYFELTLDRSEPLENRIRDSSKCGDGIRNSGEVCDYVLLNSSACSFNCELRKDNVDDYECSVDQLDRSYCWIQRCGDGKRTSSEACDDGNLNNNDGCDSNCQLEPNYLCTTYHNRTSSCRFQSPSVAVQHQNTRSQIDLGSPLTEQPQVQSLVIDSPLKTSSATSLISRTILPISAAVITTLWTAMILA